MDDIWYRTYLKEMKYKYTTKFESEIRVVYAHQQGSFISNASLSEIRALAPDGSVLQSNHDLLYNVFNAAVINRVNKNEDGITSDTAVQIFKNFIHKPMNIEHNRASVVGHIIGAGFSEYKTNRVMSEEEAKSTKDAYYLSLSAVAYKLCDPDLCALLVESSDETSAQYRSISTSWELGFNDFHILLGHKDVAEGELITDPAQVEALAKHLKCYGGSGSLSDGRPVYRIIAGEVTPLGCGYTTSPAADVTGVLVVDAMNHDGDHHKPDGDKSDEDNSSINITTIDPIDPPEEDSEISTEKEEKITSIANNYSQQQTNTVKTNSIMIKDINEITNESLPQFTAASIKTFLADKIDEAATSYAEKLDAAKAEAETKEQEKQSLSSKLSELQSKLDLLTEELSQTKAAKEAEKAQADFNLRMADLSDKYALSEKDNEIVAKAIRGLSDDAYAQWFSDFSVLAEFKSKTHIAAQQSQASSVEDVLDSQSNPQSQVQTPTVEDLKAKMAAAWDVKDIVRTR